ncbi:gag-pol polyprotein [Trichonephila clavipes]|nr:gag-pol polyprotein [Trichonephila clavipes]
MNKSPQSNFSLFAANNTKIPAYALTILTVDANISFKNILSEYPDISNPSLISKSASHGTVHPIITTGSPVTARPRSLHPKLYDAVKVEFEFLLAQGVIRPSKSPWSSPLHVVPKYDSTVRPVGDYRQLNSVTERFLPKAAEQQYLLSEFLKGSKGKKDSKPLNWSSEAITAFQRCKQALADAALLAHPSPSAPLALHVDASDYAIGGALHQVVDSELQSLAFFSRKLTSSEKSYSAYDRELLCYLLGYPTLFGSDNIAADVLSRVSAITFPSQIDYDCIAETQQTDQELHTLIASGTSLELKKVTFPNSSTEIMCDLSTGTARPYIPKQHRQDVFSAMHNLSHPGIRRSKHLMKMRAFCLSINLIRCS